MGIRRLKSRQIYMKGFGRGFKLFINIFFRYPSGVH